MYTSPSGPTVGDEEASSLTQEGAPEAGSRSGIEARVESVAASRATMRPRGRVPAGGRSFATTYTVPSSRESAGPALVWGFESAASPDAAAADTHDPAPPGVTRANPPPVSPAGFGPVTVKPKKRFPCASLVNGVETAMVAAQAAGSGSQAVPRKERVVVVPVASSGSVRASNRPPAAGRTSRPSGVITGLKLGTHRWGGRR